MKQIILIALIALFSTTVSAQTTFSNDDLEKYNKPGRGSLHVQGSERSSDEVQKAGKTGTNNDPQSDRDSWCTKGRAADDRIAVAERNAIRTEKTAKEAGSKTASDALSAADAAKAELDAAKAARQSLEDEAYRKYIPLGWLKCNF